MEDKNRSLFRLRLLGAFELVGPDGNAISLGRKAQAMIAILAINLGRPVTRTRVQDLLWSLSGPKHGRDSLKKALQSIRLAFGEYTDRVLDVRRDQLVMLQRDIWVDLHNASENDNTRDFLEGLDIPDPEFEDWLRLVRQRLSSANANEMVVRSNHIGAPTRMRLATCALIASGEAVSKYAGDLFLARLVVVVTQNDLLEVLDLTDGVIGDLGGADAVLHTRSFALGGRIQIQLSLRDRCNNAIIWSDARHLGTENLNGSIFNEAVLQIAEQVQFALCRHGLKTGPEKHAVTRMAMEGIDNLFKLRAENLQAASVCFAKAIEMEPRGSLYAWYAFLTPFRYEDNKGADLSDLREQAEMVVARALEFDPHNPMVRSLLAHVHSFLFRDFDRADSLLLPLRKAPPDTPMYDFSESMLNFYNGRLPEARRHAVASTRKGSNHAFAYAFSTSLCMIDILNGAAETAVRHGRTALSKIPKGGQPYEPALRYLTAAYAQSGEIDSARASWAHLRQLNPANNLDSLRDARFPVASDHARAALTKCYRSITQVLQ